MIVVCILRAYHTRSTVWILRARTRVIRARSVHNNTQRTLASMHTTALILATIILCILYAYYYY